MTTTAWQDDGDGPPIKFGRKGRAWLKRRLHALLFETDPTEPSRFCSRYRTRGRSWGQGAVDILLDWYLERAERYVRWVDAEVWRGRGFAAGSWDLDKEAAVESLAEGETFTLKSCDDSKCRSLDDWLALDRANKLYYAGAPGGMARVDPELRERVLAAKRKRGNVRTCPCGERFVPERRNARKCEKCKALARNEGRLGGATR